VSEQDITNCLAKAKQKPAPADDREDTELDTLGTAG